MYAYLSAYRSVYLSIFDIFWLCRQNKIPSHSIIVYSRLHLKPPQHCCPFAQNQSSIYFHILKNDSMHACLLMLFQVLFKSVIDWHNSLTFMTLLPTLLFFRQTLIRTTKIILSIYLMKKKKINIISCTIRIVVYVGPHICFVRTVNLWFYKDRLFML